MNINVIMIFLILAIVIITTQVVKYKVKGWSESGCMDRVVRDTKTAIITLCMAVVGIAGSIVVLLLCLINKGVI